MTRLIHGSSGLSYGIVDQQMTQPSPRMIGHYRVVRRLGTGGMAEVFLAQDTELERSVALKLMLSDLAKEPAQRKRFRAEAIAASALVHPNICVIHEVGETEDGRPFLAMEYVEGRTLDVLMQQRRLRLEEILNLALEAAEALDTAHSRGIVHRDIKPANLMLDRRGRLKVLDFGLAKRVGPDELSAATTSAPQTRTGMLLGTPHYMSPEQALGRAMDHRTDLFSLGAVLYELVAGQRPFLGRTVGETINNVINQTPGPLDLHAPPFAAAFEKVIFKCLEKDPQNRYRSAKLLDEELRKLKRQAEQPATPASPEAPKTVGLNSRPASAATLPALTDRGSWPRTRRVLAFGVLASFAALVIAGGILLSSKPGDRARHEERKALAIPVTPTNSVAVLPFDNFTGEADTDYLSDGLTEEITTALSRIPGLKVAGRNSAFTFKGKAKDARAVGAALRVSTLLEGSIRKVGKQLRVSAQLINAADGYHLWSETYDRSSEDLLAVQEDIARRIAEHLQEAPSPAALPGAAVHPEAHSLYLRARLFWNKRTEEGLNRAAALFQEALKKAPDYAAAQAGLASTYLLLPMYSVEPQRLERNRLARESANRALALDPSCAEAHAVLGNLQAAASDFAGAEQHFRRAIELDHNYATAHHWYGQFLSEQGERARGLAELQTAADLDPLSPIIRTSIPECYYLGGEFERAVTESRRVIEDFPDFPPARSVLIVAQLLKGDYRQALDEIEKARTLQPGQPLALLEFEGFAYARLGDKPQAEAILAKLLDRQRQGKAVEGAVGFVYLGLRDYDKTCDAFEKVAVTEGMDAHILCDPFFAEVRNLPRMQALLKKAGLPQAPPG